MTEHNMAHMDHLEEVAASDVAELRRKEATYQGSWRALPYILGGAMLGVLAGFILGIHVANWACG